jgi:hypothetical protein
MDIKRLIDAIDWNDRKVQALFLDRDIHMRSGFYIRPLGDDDGRVYDPDPLGLHHCDCSSSDDDDDDESTTEDDDDEPDLAFPVTSEQYEKHRVWIESQFSQTFIFLDDSVEWRVVAQAPNHWTVLRAHPHQTWWSQFQTDPFAVSAWAFVRHLMEIEEFFWSQCRATFISCIPSVIVKMAQYEWVAKRHAEHFWSLVREVQHQQNVRIVWSDYGLRATASRDGNVAPVPVDPPLHGFMCCDGMQPDRWPRYIGREMDARFADEPAHADSRHWDEID